MIVRTDYQVHDYKNFKVIIRADYQIVIIGTLEQWLQIITKPVVTRALDTIIMSDYLSLDYKATL